MTGYPDPPTWREYLQIALVLVMVGILVYFGVLTGLHVLRGH